MKRLIAAATALLMLGAVATTAVFAATDDDTTLKTVTFDSTIYLTDDAVSPPEVDFTYTLTSGTEGSYTNEGTEGVISAGVLPSSATESKLTETAKFTGGDYVTDGTATASKEVTFTGIDASIFETSGVYHYELSESYTYAGSALYDVNVAETYHVYVTVVFDETSTYNNGLTIDSVSIYAEVPTDFSTSTKISTIAHSYGFDVSDPTNPTTDNSGIDFIVTDTAFGSWASRTEEFTFTIKTTGIASGTVLKYGYAEGSDDTTGGYIFILNGEAYLAEESQVAGTVFSYSTSDELTVKLSHGEAFYIYSVVEGMNFTVTIAGDDSYTFYARDYYTGTETGTGTDGDSTGDTTTYDYTVTYTDGVDEGVWFADETFGANYGDTTPAFTGSTDKADYIFIGWSPEVADNVTGNATYEATWAEDFNNNAIGDDSETKYSVTYVTGLDNSVIVNDMPATVTGILEGLTINLSSLIADYSVDYINYYEITGWTCSADGETYLPSAIYKMPAENVTFTAVWALKATVNADDNLPLSTTSGSGLVLTTLGTTTASTSGATFANLGSGTSTGVTMQMISSTGGETTDPTDTTKTDAYWYELPDESNVTDGATNWSYTIAAASSKGSVQGIDFGTVSGLYDGSTDDEGIEYGAGLPTTGVVLDLAPYAILIALVALLGCAKVYFACDNRIRLERGDEL